MNLGRKSSVITSSLGVKNSKPSLSLGVKQSHNPNMDMDNLMKQYTSDGIINNQSNSNYAQYEPIKGVNLPSHKVNHNKNYLEKAHKNKSEKGKNHFG